MRLCSRISTIPAGGGQRRDHLFVLSVLISSFAPPLPAEQHAYILLCLKTAVLLVQQLPFSKQLQFRIEGSPGLRS
jgi:hypothetical protein